MKKSWFFFPLGILMKGLGGIPVERSKNSDLTVRIAHDFAKLDYMNLAITPEGTRSGVTQWHTGFLRIANAACVPVQLGIIDFTRKEVIIRDEFMPSENIDQDLDMVRRYYRSYGNCARHPEKFQP